jgi:hypothetical protein
VSYYKTAFTELAPGSLHSELVDNDRLLLTKQNSEYQSSIGEIVIGDYEYESEALFGSPSTSSGHWVYHPDTHLFGFAEEFGEFKLNSGPLQQLTEFCDVVGVEGVSAEETHELYNEYSTSVFDVRFTPEWRTYDRDSRQDTEYDPERDMELRAQDSASVMMSAENVRELAQDKISKGRFVSSAKLSVNDCAMRYTAPYCFHVRENDVDDTMEAASQALFVINDVFY